MTVYTCTFRGDKTGEWDALKSALVASVRVNMPQAEIVTEELEPPERLSPIESNHHKFLAWAAFVARTPGKIILMDTDMVTNGDLFTAFGDWDVGITERSEGASMPLNGGVVFLNDTDGAREFMRRWLKWELEYYNNRDLYRDWYKKFCGPNQTALGLLLKHDAKGLKIQVLPCRTWNACEDDWPYCDKAKAIHIKSGRARRGVINDGIHEFPNDLVLVRKVWRKYV